MAGGAEPTPPKEGLTIEDRWILSRLNGTIAAVTEALEKLEFSDAAQALYRFTWNEFCDWYIEHAKRRTDDAAKRVLTHVVDVTLRLLHPIAPFVTEELWQRFHGPGSFVMLAEWPEADQSRRDPELERRMELVFESVRAVREIRRRYDIANAEPLEARVSAKDDATARSLREGAETVKHLANLSAVEVGAGIEKPKRWASVVVEDAAVYFNLVGKFDAAKERAKTEKQLAEGRAQAEQISARLSNERFRQAKPEMAAQEEEKLAGLKEQIRQLEEHLRELAE
jgi:valyl-tRNA synthetase